MPPVYRVNPDRVTDGSHVIRVTSYTSPYVGTV